MVNGNLTPYHIAVDHKGEILVLDQFLVQSEFPIDVRKKVEEQSWFIAPEELENKDNLRYVF